MCSVNNKAANIQALVQHLSQQDLSGVDMLCLPENSLFMRASQKDPVEAFDLTRDHGLEELVQIAKDTKTFLHLGAIPIFSEGKVFNSSVHIMPDGSIEESYRKIHLFDVELENQHIVRESDAYQHGSNLSMFEYQGINFGQTICYDLRFSNLFLAYASLHADVILAPASFFHVTGKDHWEVLLRARAIETQTFVIASAQGGVHCGKQKTWGHSMVIDPWGHILGEIKETSETPQSIRVDLDLDLIQQARKKIPLHQHRKEEF